MVKNKQTDEEAIDELAAWCRPFGLTPCVFSDRVCVSWLDPAKPDDEWGFTAIEMKRPSTGNWSPKPHWIPKRVSIATTCRKIINEYFKCGKELSWARKTSEKAGLYDIVREETILMKIPKADSPAELELKLAALGWTGNPFGPSREMSTTVA